MESNTKKILSTVGLSSAVVLAGLAFDTTTSEASTDVSATQVKVEAGDTYKSIAESHNASVSALEQANGREVGGFDLIFPNEIITLPEASVATSTSTTATTQPVSDNTQTQTQTITNNNNTESVSVNNDSQVTTGTTNQAPVQTQTTNNYNDQVLSASAGRITNSYGNSETYYNLPENVVVANANAQGIKGDYWVRGDGVKMFGDYVIVAANRSLYPYGSTMNTSLGTGISLDSGTFIYSNPNQLDIATTW